MILKYGIYQLVKNKYCIIINIGLILFVIHQMVYILYQEVLIQLLKYGMLNPNNYYKQYIIKNLFFRFVFHMIVYISHQEVKIKMLTYIMVKLVN